MFLTRGNAWKTAEVATRTKILEKCLKLIAWASNLNVFFKCETTYGSCYVTTQFKSQNNCLMFIQSLPGMINPCKWGQAHLNTWTVTCKKYIRIFSSPHFLSVRHISALTKSSFFFLLLLATRVKICWSMGGVQGFCFFNPKDPLLNA